MAYEEEKALALELIGDPEVGGDVTFFVKAEGAVDPTKPWRSGAADPVSYPAKAVIFDYDIQLQSMKPNARNMLVPSASITVRITEDMMVETGDGTIFEVRHVTEVKPNGIDTILFDLEVAEWGSTLNKL